MVSAELVGQLTAIAKIKKETHLLLSDIRQPSPWLESFDSSPTPLINWLSNLFLRTTPFPYTLEHKHLCFV